MPDPDDGKIEVFDWPKLPPLDLGDGELQKTSFSLLRKKWDFINSEFSYPSWWVNTGFIFLQLCAL